MATSTTYSYDILFKTGNSIPALDKIGVSAKKTTTLFEGLKNSARKFGECSFVFNNINDQLQRFQGGLNSVIQPGVALDSSMKDLSAVTGQTGKGLQAIEKYARQTAKTFGGDASQAAESYKLILSQLSPEIAKCPDALKAMGDSAAITSKLMGGNVAAATSVLTTAMNQFQVSTINPIEASKEMNRMMNIMAAAAQAGSAELPAIQQALEQSGMAAKAAGVSFAEANSAIQVLDKAGKKGSEGGIALRNVMATLSQGRFLPKDVQQELQAAGVRISDLTDTSKTLSERLNPLKAVMGDAALITKLFGKENANAAVALLSGTDQMNAWTSSISGTNSATEQASIVMSSYAEKMSRLKAKMDDLKISIFSVAKGALPFLQGAMTATQGVADMFTIACGIQTLSETALGKAILSRAKATKVATVAMWNNIRAMFSSHNLFTLYFNSVLFCSFAWQIFKNRVKSATQSIFINIRSVLSSMSSMSMYSIALGIASASTYVFAASIRVLSKAIYAIPIIGWIAAGISLLVGGFTLLWNKSEKFRQVIFTIWEVVKTVFCNIGVAIKGLFNNIIKPYVMFWFNLYKGLAMGIWSSLKWCWDMISQGLSMLGNFFTSSWSWISNTITGVISGIGSFFGGVWDWMGEKSTGVTGAIVAAFNWITEPIKKVFTGIGDFFTQVWDKIIEGLAKPFKWIQELWNKVFPKDQFKNLGDAIAVGKQKGTQSWNKSQKSKTEESLLGKKTNTKALTSSITPITPVVSGITATPISSIASDSSSKTNMDSNVNLNNVKGTSSYGAIVAKLSPKSFAGLGGGIAKFATTMAVAGGIASASLSPVNNPTPETQAAVIQEYRESKKENKIQFAKFCENVVINVPQGTTRAQVDAILKELMQKINSLG